MELASPFGVVVCLSVGFLDGRRDSLKETTTAAARNMMQERERRPAFTYAQVLNQTYMPEKWPQGFWPQNLIIPGLDFMKNTISDFWTLFAYITLIQNVDFSLKNQGFTWILIVNFNILNKCYIGESCPEIKFGIFHEVQTWYDQNLRLKPLGSFFRHIGLIQDLCVNP